MVVTGYGSYNGEEYYLVKNRYIHAVKSYISYTTGENNIFILQLGHSLGYEWLHSHDQEPVQPVWDCH